MQKSYPCQKGRTSDEGKGELRRKRRAKLKNGPAKQAEQKGLELPHLLPDKGHSSTKRRLKHGRQFPRLAIGRCNRFILRSGTRHGRFDKNLVDAREADETERLFEI